MKNERLIINGQPLDTFADGGKLAFSVSSNLLCKLSDYTCGYSYSYDVPTTPHNMAVLGQLLILGASGRKVRQFLPAEYERDGVLMLKGRAMITKVTADKVSLSLLFGLSSNLRAMIDTDTTLDELNWSNPERIIVGEDNEQKPADNLLPYTTTALPYWLDGQPQPTISRFFYFMNRRYFGTKKPKPCESIPMSVAVSDIIAQIESDCRISTGVNADGVFLQYCPKWRKSGNISFQSETVHYLGKKGKNYKCYAVSAYYGYGEALSDVKKEDVEESYGDFTPKLYARAEFGSLWVATSKMPASGLVMAAYLYEGQSVDVLFDANGAPVNQTLGYLPTTAATTEFKPKENAFSASYKPVTIVFLSGVDVDKEMSFHVSIEGKFQHEEAEQGCFNPAHCLPAIKVADFLQAVEFCLHGGYAVNTLKGGKDITFVNLDEVAKTEPYDWSDKLLADGIEAGWTLDDLAQKNYITWADDESEAAYTNHAYDVALPTDDDTLEAESDLAELPFSYSYNAGYTPQMITWADDEKKTPAPRLVVATATGGHINPHDKNDTKIYKGYTQAPLYWEQSPNYMVGVIWEPSTLTCKVALTTVEVANLDLSRKVWLKQFGKYFFIRKLDVGGDNIATAKLVELKKR